MSKGALKSITVHNLRGSATPFTLNFEKGKKLSIIYGENGTGKSTICDAFDFLGNGNVGSLDGKGLGKTNKYWQTLGKNSGDVSVTLEDSLGSCTATLVKSNVVTDPFDAIPKVEVLRRSQILRLVEANPADRYKAISQFIDVSGIEASENNLRKLIREIDSSIEVAVARVHENRETISRFWSEAGNPAIDSMEWAELEIQKDQSEITLKRASVEALKSSVNNLLSYVVDYKEKANAISKTQGELKEFEALVNLLSDRLSGEYAEILEVLIAAKHHFSIHPNFDVCPLCESSENIANLPQKIDARIQALGVANQLKQAKTSHDTKKQILELLEQQLAELNTQAVSAAENFVFASKDKRLPGNMSLPSLDFPKDLSLWESWLAASAQMLTEWSRISDAYLSSEKFTKTLKSSLDALYENSKIKEDLDVLLPRLNQILSIVETERKAFTDNILHRIAVDVGKLYEVVHPGEGLNKITLELDPVKRASLEISTEFQGKNDTPPQAYFSDSHLDTLGLCVFLALAKMDAPDETILVLDDVLGSVDEPHVDRLIEMLYAEALVFRQCIITTHYKPWKQKLRWGWLKNGQCQFIELNKWTLANGISLTKSIPDIERLRMLLTEAHPDPQLVCAKAGVILEAALDFLTLLYECRVPRRTDSLYTLGDLLPIDKKLQSALKVEHKLENPDGTVVYIERQLSPHLEKITQIAQVRNVFGCHFNALSFELLDSDALLFGSEVLALMDCLVDHELGWPRSQKSGSYWATTGETRRLHPFKRPS